MLIAAQHEPIADLPHILVRSLASLIPPLVVLVLAHWLVPLAAQYLPRPLEGLLVWGPAMLLFLGATLSLTFNRGRMMVAALSLGSAYLAHQFNWLDTLDAFPGRGVYAAACVLVPLNLVTLSLLQERGVFTLFGMRRMLALLLQIALVVWIVASGQTALVERLFAFELNLPLPASPLPDLAMLAMLGGGLFIACRAAVRRSALDAGLAGALLAFALACHHFHEPAQFALYSGAAGGALAVAVLQDTFRLAFRDELTGLPSRRALNERMLALGNHYTIAMLDVDHFKQFNDVHGHELGDHVLRMVSAKLERVGCAGRAYRFGGEEFAIVFPGRRVHQVWPHVDALRRQIAEHALVLRTAPRKPGARGRHGVRPLSVCVTVSIGLAERGERTTTPDHVLVAADRALYRAKHKGRNRISL